jgi:hypothetical protein
MILLAWHTRSSNDSGLGHLSIHRNVQLPSVRHREGHQVAQMVIPVVIDAEASEYGKACERCSLPRRR